MPPRELSTKRQPNGVGEPLVALVRLLARQAAAEVLAEDAQRAQSPTSNVPGK